MTFDEDERSDPERRWSTKLPAGEVLSEDFLGLTSENVIRKSSSTYDPVSKKITNEMVLGACSCGTVLTESNSIRCYYSDLACSGCATRHNGRGICRMHTECYLGSKEETVVLVSVCLGLNPSETKKFGMLSDESLLDAFYLLCGRGYVKRKTFGIFSGAKVTKSGNEVLKTLIDVYKKDSDFADFLVRTGWS